jgi:nucleoside-diphosphate-sugar epimerase
MTLPLAPAKVAVGVAEALARLIGRNSPITRAMIEKYAEDVAVSSRRIQTELGFVPKYDLMTGWRETVEEMRRIGEL